MTPKTSTCDTRCIVNHFNFFGNHFNFFGNHCNFPSFPKVLDIFSQLEENALGRDRGVGAGVWALVQPRERARPGVLNGSLMLRVG